VKTILLWDMRFPERRPSRLTVADAVASACVRAGVAAAADPADAGTLSSGGALSGSGPVEVALQHGAGVQRTLRVALPLAAAQVAIAAGLAAATSPSAIVILIPANAILNASGGYVLNASGGYVLNRSAA
jgi:hypothetical protein